MQIKSATYDQTANSWNIEFVSESNGWSTPKNVVCPDCKSDNVHKNGNYIKGGKRYLCSNDKCKRISFIANEPSIFAAHTFPHNFYLTI